MTCRITACSNARATRWSSYCTSHRNRNRRHGHPLQDSIKKNTLEPYVDRVRQRIIRNANSEAWSLILRRWEALVRYCAELVAAYRRGLPHQRHQRQAASALLQVSDHVSQTAVMETCLALYLHQDEQPRCYRSDRAFLFQMARRVHSLTETSVGAWFNHRTGKVSKVYRDMPPRATEWMGQWLAEGFGAAGLHLAQLERTKNQQRQDDINQMHRAMEAIA
jgi:hypothetical protein